MSPVPVWLAVPPPVWGCRRYRREIYCKLQLLCHQYVARCILWGSAPLRCRRNEGGQNPCEMRSYTRIAFKALRKLREPWPKNSDFSHLHYRKKTANNAWNPRQRVRRPIVCRDTVYKGTRRQGIRAALRSLGPLQRRFRGPAFRALLFVATLHTMASPSRSPQVLARTVIVMPARTQAP